MTADTVHQEKKKHKNTWKHESTSEMRQRLNLNNEREHMILWRKINRKLYEVYNDTTTIETQLKKDGLNQTDNNKATHRGRSSGIGQDSERTSTNSPDENRETCNLIREVSNQATEAPSARDMSVAAMIPSEDPP